MENKTQTIIDENKVMDVREIPCSIKHGLILKTWYELPVGDYFILCNDHDPVPLYYQFTAQFGSAVSWEQVERSPEKVQVKITKLAAVPNLDLPSSCGGH